MTGTMTGAKGKIRSEGDGVSLSVRPDPRTAVQGLDLTLETSVRIGEGPVGAGKTGRFRITYEGGYAFQRFADPNGLFTVAEQSQGKIVLESAEISVDDARAGAQAFPVVRVLGDPAFGHTVLRSRAEFVGTGIDVPGAGSPLQEIPYVQNCALYLSPGTVQPARPVAGGAAASLTWTLTNKGPSSADYVGAAVSYGQPPHGPGPELVDIAVNGQSLGREMQFMVPYLGVGATAQIVATFRYPPELRGHLDASCWAYRAAREPSDTVSVDITARTKLMLAGEPATPVQAGQEASFGWRLTNTGPSTATDTSVQATLPPGTTFSSATDNGTPQSDGTVLWKLGTLPPATQRILTVRAATSPDAWTALRAEASGWSSTPDDTGNPAGTGEHHVTVPVQERATVAFPSATASPRQVVAGKEPLTYTWQLRNRGPSSARDLTVTASLPKGVTFVSATHGGVFRPADHTVGWDLGRCPPGDVPLSVTVAVRPESVGPQTATARATSPTTDGQTGKPVQATAPEATATAEARAALSLKAGSADPASVVAGNRDSPVTLRWTLANTGPSTATAVTASVSLPADAHYLSASPAATVQGRTACWKLPALPPSGPVELKVTVWAAPEARDRLALPARANAATKDPATDAPATTGERPASVPVTVKAPLTVTETRFVPGTVQGKDQLALSWCLHNQGPSLARGVTCDVDLPATLTLAEGQKLPYVHPGLEPGAQGWFTLITVVGSGADGEKEVSATGRFSTEGSPQAQRAIRVPVKREDRGPFTIPAPIPPFPPFPPFPPPVVGGGGGGGGDEPGTDDSDESEEKKKEHDKKDEKTKTTTLKFVKAEADPASVDAGGRFTYTWVLKNTGRKITATNVYLVLTLPSGITPTAVSGFTAVPTKGVITGYLRSLAPGRQVTLSVRSTVDDTTTGTLKARATAGSAQAQPVWKSAEAKARAKADLELDGSVSPDPVDPGQKLTYAWTLTNKGPSAATKTRARVRLPEGVNDPAGRVIQGGNQTATWEADKRELVFADLGTLAKGRSLVLRATAVVGKKAPASLPATAYARAEDSPREVTNQQTATCRAALSLTVQPAPAEVIAGRDLTYVWTLAHTGGPAAEEVTLGAGLPASSPYRAASHGGAPAEGAQRVAWPRIERLQPGERRTFTTTVTLAPAAEDRASGVTGTATARNAAKASATCDPVPVTHRSALEITGLGTPSPTPVGQPVAFVWTVRNTGPSVAAGSTTTLVLPPELKNPGITVQQDGSAETVSASPVPLGELSPGATVSVHATGTADVDQLGQAPGPVVARAELSDTGSTLSAAAWADLSSDAALRLTPDAETAKTRTVEAGTQTCLTWTAAKSGRCATDQAALQITLPTGLRAAGVTVDGQPPSSLRQDNGRLIIGLGCLREGAEHAVAVTADVLPDLPATGTGGADPQPLQVLARLSADGAEPVGDVARLQVAVRSTVEIGELQLPYPVAAGDDTSLVWTIANSGPSTAKSATLVVTLPAELSFRYATVDAAPCSGVPDPAHGGRWSLPVGDLPPEGAVQVCVRAAVSADPARRELTVSRAAVVGSRSQVSAGGDQVTVTVAPKADVVTSVRPSAPYTGDTVTHVWNLTNVGRCTLSGATFTAELTGAGYEPDPASTVAGATVGTAEGRSVLTVPVPALAPQAAYTVTLAGQVASAGRLTATPSLKDRKGTVLKPTPGPTSTTVTERPTKPDTRSEPVPATLEGR
ncbi:hypothetical protein [Streptomyces sp. bgisy130]|uniref:hypothetical protein n=1 Tax=Streptomyces sp. bgisy130 TaxID=3413788 RepID=UPI003F49F158